MEKMQIYNAVRKVPDTAQKTFSNGRVKNFTDINPMWRIQILTETFGMCGVGWYYDIVEKRLEPFGTEDIACFVDINLFVFTDSWSKPIAGTGGSTFVSSNKNGTYVSDECFKMALTDAISVACKALGIGADIYWAAGAQTKYDKDIPERTVDKATPEQVSVLAETYTGESLAKLLAKNQITALSEMSYDRAASYIKAVNEYKAKKAES